MDLEEYLTSNFNKKIIDHSIRVTVGEDGLVSFYIHANGKDSETLDFQVIGNIIIPI